MTNGSAVSELLRSWGRGDLEARDRLLPLVYRELKKQAAACLRQERRDHTLQPTALVHEAYLRLCRFDHLAWQNRAQFFALAAQSMRRILIDYARERRTEKRGGALVRVALNEGVGASPPVDCDLLLLNDSLDELARRDPRQVEIVELRYFAGLSEREVATVLSLSRATVTREWQTARAWLYRRMTAKARTS